jgi:uncharacterized protein
VATNATCNACKYAFFCGGGCARRAFDKMGTLFASDCDGFKKRFRAAAAAAFADVRRGIQPEPIPEVSCGEA